jgi:hypothetical protein
VTERLYTKGIKDREKRMKVTDEFNHFPKPPQEWSCVKCGTIQLLHYDNLREKLEKDGAYDKNNIAEMIRCSSCGFEWTDQPTFKPVNIALDYHNKTTTLENLGSLRLSLKDGDLHEYLYKNPKLNKKKYDFVVAQHMAEDRHRMTFKPAPNAESEQILSTLKNITIDMEKSASTCYPEEKIKIGEYFRKAPHERLYEDRAPLIRKHREDHGPLDLRPRKSRVPYMFTGPDSRRKPVYGRPIDTKTFHASKVKPPPMYSSGKYDGVIRRLMTEEEKRQQKQRQRTEMFNMFDHRTGQPLYQPKIPDPLVVEGKVVGTMAARSSFKLIMLK